MKCRNGFVSNSSSSSFIIALKKKPESPLEVKRLLFKGGHFSLKEDGITDDLAAERIFNDLKKSSLASKSKILDVLKKGYPLSDYEPVPYPNLYGLPKEKSKEVFDKYLEKVDALNKKIADEFYAKTEGKKYYILSYSDNNGQEECSLEHGGTFNVVPHIQLVS